MADFKSANFTAMDDARVNKSRLAPQNVNSGDVETAVIPYTLLGTEVANDRIFLGYLPKGAVPIPAFSNIVSADPGTTLTVDVGTAADTDGWFDDVVLSAGGQVNACSTTPLPAWVAQTPIVADAADTATNISTGNAAVFATVKTAATLTQGVVLYFNLRWKRSRG